MNRLRTRRLRALPIALAAAAATLLTACSEAGGGASNSAGEVDQDAVDTANEALADLEGQVLSTGPNGEKASPAEDVVLSDEQVAEVKAMGAKAAIVMHYGGNDWSTAQVDGLNSEFERLGIEVVATTDADFKPEQQVSDIETVMTRDPNIIVSIPPTRWPRPARTRPPPTRA